jgi:Protein of unknown function, DUF481
MLGRGKSLIALQSIRFRFTNSMNKNKSSRPAATLQYLAASLILVTVGLFPMSGIAQTTEAAEPVEAVPEETLSEETATREPRRPDAITAPDASAATTPEAAAELPVEEEADPWQAFYPPPDSRFDWLQLTSGEWLKGEIKGLYNFELEFESDELDTLKVDWDDVKILRSAGPQAVRYTDPQNVRVPLTAFGQLTLIGNTATIGSSPNTTTVTRDQIITIATGTQKEADFWSGEVSIGANVRSGNSDVADGAVTALVQRRKADSRFQADYRGNFSRTAGVETQNNHRINSFYDSFRTSRLYWRVLFGEYFRDKFQNINHQLTVGTGAGYDIKRTKKTEWDVSAGVGFLYKEAVSVEATEDAGNVSPALTLGTYFDTELTKRLDYELRYNLRIVDEQNGELIQNLVTTLSSDITGNLDLDLTLTWDRTEKPQPRENGEVPDQDDFRFTVSIAYEF